MVNSLNQVHSQKSSDYQPLKPRFKGGSTDFIDSLNIYKDDEFLSRKNDIDELRSETKEEKSKPLRTILNVSYAAAFAGAALFVFNKSLSVANKQLSAAKDIIANNKNFIKVKDTAAKVVATSAKNIQKSYSVTRESILQKAADNPNKMLPRVIKNGLLKTENAVIKTGSVVKNTAKTISNHTPDSVKSYLSKSAIGNGLKNFGGSCVALYTGVEALQEVSKND